MSAIIPENTDTVDTRHFFFLNREPLLSIKQADWSTERYWLALDCCTRAIDRHRYDGWMDGWMDGWLWWRGYYTLGRPGMTYMSFESLHGKLCSVKLFHQKHIITKRSLLNCFGSLLDGCAVSVSTRFWAVTYLKQAREKTRKSFVRISVI